MMKWNSSGPAVVAEAHRGDQWVAAKMANPQE